MPLRENSTETEKGVATGAANGAWSHGLNGKTEDDGEELLAEAPSPEAGWNRASKGINYDCQGSRGRTYFGSKFG